MFLPSSVRALHSNVRRTFKYDAIAGIARGLVMTGGAATAAVVLKKEFDGSNAEVALLYSATGVGFLATLVTSRWVKRFSAMPLVVVPEALAYILFMLVAFAAQSWMFTLLLCTAYALMGSLQPALAQVYKSNYPDSTRGSVFSLVRMSMMVTNLVAAQLIGMLLDARPTLYLYAYPAIGLIGLIGVWVFSRIRVLDSKGEIENGDGEAGPSFSVFWRILKTNKPFAAFMAVWGLFGFGNHLVNPVKAKYLTDPAYGIAASYTASLLILVVLPQAVVVLTLRLWGGLLDRFPATTVRVPVHVATTVGLILWATSDSLWVLGIAGVMWGIASAGGQILWHVGIFEFAGENEVPLYMGIHVGLTGIRALVGPHLGNMLVDLVGISATFWVSVALSGTSILFIIWLAWVMRRKKIGRYSAAVAK